MPSGIKIKELVPGTGAVAEHDKIAFVHVRGFLRRGEECYSTYEHGQPLCVDFTRRDCIAGLRKGIEGMRVGEKRELIVSPHLAYGNAGIPGRIPPNALIRFEVELLEVRERGMIHPEDFPPGKQLIVSGDGDLVKKTPRWQFGARENQGDAGLTLTYPLPDGSWRHAPTRSIQIKLDKSEIIASIQSAESTLIHFPKDCVSADDVCVDYSEKNNPLTRINRINERCLNVLIWEKGKVILNFYIAESSPVLASAKFYQTISSALTPHLTRDAAKPEK